MGAVHCGLPHVMHSPEYKTLLNMCKTEPALRRAEQLEVVRKMLSEMPFFMNFHGTESGAQTALEILMKNLVIEPALAQTEVLWHEGSSMDDRRFMLHIILKGQVKHYLKGSGVEPLQLSSIEWDDLASITKVIGKELSEIVTAGNIVGGPAELSMSMAEETLVGLKGTVFGTINKQM